MASVVVSPSPIVRSGNTPTATGPRFGTVTGKLWDTVRPSGSAAVAVITASPLVAARMMIVPLEILTVATRRLEIATL